MECKSNVHISCRSDHSVDCGDSTVDIDNNIVRPEIHDSQHHPLLSKDFMKCREILFAVLVSPYREDFMTDHSTDKVNFAERRFSYVILEHVSKT